MADTESQRIHYKLVTPASDSFWVTATSTGYLVTPQNKDFDRQHIVQRLSELQASGRLTYQEIDGDDLLDGERGKLYGDAAWAARDANVQVKPCFGRGGDYLGKEVPVLLGYMYDEEPLIVYPHQLPDGSWKTIREYVDLL
jgi:hypothetical protein